MNKTLKITHMFRVNVANHMIRTVQGVTEGVLISSIMETFNHSWKPQKWKSRIERLSKNTIYSLDQTNKSIALNSCSWVVRSVSWWQCLSPYPLRTDTKYATSVNQWHSRLWTHGIHSYIGSQSCLHVTYATAAAAITIHPCIPQHHAIVIDDVLWSIGPQLE